MAPGRLKTCQLEGMVRIGSTVPAYDLQGRCTSNRREKPEQHFDPAFQCRKNLGKIPLLHLPLPPCAAKGMHQPASQQV